MPVVLSVVVLMCVSMVKSGRYHGGYRSYSRSSYRSDQPRKRKLVDTPMDERPHCKFFKDGKCNKVSTSSGFFSTSNRNAPATSVLLFSVLFTGNHSAY